MIECERCDMYTDEVWEYDGLLVCENCFAEMQEEDELGT